MNAIEKAKKQEINRLTPSAKMPWRFSALGHGLSKPVKAGFIAQGQFFLSDKEASRCIGIGKKRVTGGKISYYFNCVLGPWRPHAVRMENNSVTLESYNLNEKDFKAIMAAADSGQDKYPVLTNKYGVEIMVYIPPDQLTRPDGYAEEAFNAEFGNGVIALFHYNSKSSRQYGRIVELYPEGTQMEIGSELVNGRSFDFWTPSGQTPIDNAVTPDQLTMAIESMNLLREPFLRPRVGEEIGSAAQAVEVER